MKKIISVLLAFGILTGSCYATAVLYRNSSKEVIEINASGDTITQTYDGDYFSVDTNPTFIDGTEFFDSTGHLRVLGYSKIYDGGNVRDAIQSEIDGFLSSEQDDWNNLEAEQAKTMLQNDKKLRRILIAVFDTFIEHEFNKNRTWFTAFQAEVAASTSLADFKDRMATLPAMPQRTLSQLRTQILDRISKDD